MSLLGRRNGWSLCAVSMVSFALLAGGCPPPPPDPHLINGETLHTDYCSRCHCYEGWGCCDQDAPDHRAADEALLREIVLEPPRVTTNTFHTGGKYDPFLSDEDIQDIQVFLESQQDKGDGLCVQ